MSLPPDHDQEVRSPHRLGAPATRFGDESTLPLRPVRQIEAQPKYQPWWLLWLLLTLALAVLLGLSPFLYAAIRDSSGPTATPLVQHSTVATSVTGSTRPATVTASPRAARSPTATAISGKFTVSPTTTQQKCSLALPLPSFTLSLSNLSASPVGYHVSVVTPMPGTTTPWASVSPASGSIAAKAHQQVHVTPKATLCTDSHFRGTKSFLLSVTAASGASATFRVTDLVTSAV